GVHPGAAAKPERECGSDSARAGDAIADAQVSRRPGLGCNSAGARGTVQGTTGGAQLSPARVNIDLLAPPVAHTIQRRSLYIGLVFAVLSVIGIFISPPEQFLHSYLLGYMAWLGLTLGCMAVLMLQYLTCGSWGLVIRRILEAGMKTLPLMLLLFIPLAVGVHHLYKWAEPGKVAADKHLQEITRDFLNPTGFVLRSIFTWWFGVG